MNFRTLWSTDGFFYSKDGQLAPTGVRSRITVPSHRTSWETAAMVEIAGRIGLHLAELPLPIFDHLFVFDQLDPVPQEQTQSNRLHIVLGYDRDWLYQVLGEKMEPLFLVRDHRHKETGILYISNNQDQTLLVVTGTSPEMTLHAVRSFVTDHFVNTCKEEDSFFFIPKEPNFSPPVSAQLNAKTLEKFSLHNLFTTEGIYQKNEAELYPTLDVSFDISESNLDVTVASIELAARLALSAGYVNFPMTTCADEEKNSNRFLISFDTKYSNNDQTKFELTSVNAAPSLIIRSNPNKLIDTVRELMADWFTPLDVLELDTWRHRFETLKSSHQDIQLRAQLGMQSFAETNRGNVSHLVIPEHLANPIGLWHRYLGEHKRGRSIPLSIDTEKPIWTAHWEDSGELADMESYILAFLAQMKKNGSIKMEIAIEVTTTISEATFKTWVEHLKAKIYEQWGFRTEFIYRDANKSGLHWAMHEVLPQLKQQKEIHTVDLQARAFLPEKKHLDLVHRFLQEFYPFDSILTAELQLPLERINLRLIEDASAPMFSVVARDGQGIELASWSWEGWAESCPYMPDQPEQGNVMVPFAGCRIYQKGQTTELASQSFQTNPYRFWVWYQQFVLPQVITQIEKNKGVPKFLRLECHVGMDAVDIKLPHLEEVSSVLEALHEDIYFYTLHALHEHGKETGDSGWDAPGGILPFMHEEAGGKPNASIALYALPTDHEVKLVYQNSEEKTLKPISPSLIQPAKIVALTRQKDQSAFSFSGFSDPNLEKDCDRWLASSSSMDKSQRVDTPPSEVKKEKSVIDDIFGSVDVQHWLEARKEKIPGQVTPIEFSFNGQRIWLVELYAKGKNGESISSFQKQSLYKPTFFINARHHANEVSSTNAALQLIDQLATDPTILNRLNLVIVPLENVDGAALHAQMASEHPCWKLHAARYNACGLEFAKYRFQQDTPFGESRVYPKVWQRWAPDIVLDDHGVPSHEWIQPFSGYNSPPRFPVSYWIPSARMYTIWRQLNDFTDVQLEAYLSLRSFVTKKLDQDKAVASDNTDWLNTYIRWGNAFDKKHFPVELSNGSIAFTRKSKTKKDSYDLIERFANWVTADLITEVNDETVYDKELAACTHAHHVVHQAILDWMRDKDVQLHLRRESLENGTIRIGLERSRPL